MAERSAGRTLGNLALAVLNATLILAALCLWLAWSAFAAAERVSLQVVEAAEAVLPLRAEIVTLSEEIAAMRSDLAERRVDATDATGTTSALSARIEGIETQLAALTAAIRDLETDPETLVAQAVTSAFDSVGQTVTVIVLGLRDGPEAATVPPTD